VCEREIERERGRERERENERERERHIYGYGLYVSLRGWNERKTFFNMMQTAKNAYWVGFLPEPVQQISARQGPPTTISRMAE
jgi:hypothetical protein